MSNRTNINKSEYSNAFETKKSAEKFSVKKNMAKIAILLTFLGGTIAGFFGNEALDAMEANKLVASHDRSTYTVEQDDTIIKNVLPLVDADYNNDGKIDVDQREITSEIIDYNKKAFEDGTLTPNETISYPNEYVKQKDNN